MLHNIVRYEIPLSLELVSGGIGKNIYETVSPILLPAAACDFCVHVARGRVINSKMAKHPINTFSFTTCLCTVTSLNFLEKKIRRKVEPKKAPIKAVGDPFSYVLHIDIRNILCFLLLLPSIRVLRNFECSSMRPQPREVVVVRSKLPPALHSHFFLSLFRVDGPFRRKSQVKYYSK